MRVSLSLKIMNTSNDENKIRGSKPGRIHLSFKNIVLSESTENHGIVITQLFHIISYINSLVSYKGIAGSQV